MKTKVKVAGEAAKVVIDDVKNFIIECVIFVMTTIIHHVVVILKTPKTIGGRIIDSIKIHDCMDGNVWFTNPDIPMPDFLVLIQAYEAAAAAVTAKAGPDVEAKLQKAWEELDLARKILRNYVQGICLNIPEHAAEIATSAGMYIKTITPRKAQEFTVRALEAGNGAELSGKIKQRGCAHEFQCTYDPADPMSWYVKIIVVTFQSRITVTGFDHDKRVYFRHRCITKTGETEWSPVISILIS